MAKSSCIPSFAAIARHLILAIVSLLGMLSPVYATLAFNGEVVVDLYEGSFVGELSEATYSFVPKSGYGYLLQVHGTWFDPDATGLTGYNLAGDPQVLPPVVRWFDSATQTFSMRLQPSANVGRYDVTIYGAKLGSGGGVVMPSSLVSTVPEPSTAAMWLLGMSAAAFAAGRRRVRTNAMASLPNQPHRRALAP